MNKLTGENYFEEMVGRLKMLKDAENIEVPNNFKNNLKAQLFERALEIKNESGGSTIGDWLGQWRFLLAAVPSLAIVTLVAVNIYGSINNTGNIENDLDGALLSNTSLKTEDLETASFDQMVNEIESAGFAPNASSLVAVSSAQIETFDARLVMPASEVLDEYYARNNIDVEGRGGRVVLVAEEAGRVGELTVNKEELTPVSQADLAKLAEDIEVDTKYLFPENVNNTVTPTVVRSRYVVVYEPVVSDRNRSVMNENAVLTNQNYFDQNVEEVRLPDGFKEQVDEVKISSQALEKQVIQNPVAAVPATFSSAKSVNDEKFAKSPVVENSEIITADTSAASTESVSQTIEVAKQELVQSEVNTNANLNSRMVQQQQLETSISSSPEELSEVKTKTLTAPKFVAVEDIVESKLEYSQDDRKYLIAILVRWMSQNNIDPSVYSKITAEKSEGGWNMTFWKNQVVLKINLPWNYGSQKEVIIK